MTPEFETPYGRPEYLKEICAICGGERGLHNHMNQACPKDPNANRDHTEYRTTTFTSPFIRGYNCEGKKAAVSDGNGDKVLEELVGILETGISSSIIQGEPEASYSWLEQVGVLISCKHAKQILSIINPPKK